ncbi:MAG: hypothetical protein SGI90_09850 [Candidatus Eisenbacteria bacterium]|nr:hypothetical protein [Candidatus Eisenbacteria bacterium]
MQRLNRLILAPITLILGLSPLVLVNGCAEMPGRIDTPILPQTSEDNVLSNFQVAYRQKRIDEYAKLLANDFQFYFDPVTRGQLGIEFWTRTEDSLRTEQLFTSPEVTKIVIELDWPARSATGAGFLAPRERWTKLFLTDVYLDVDFAPIGQEVTTFRVEQQQQRFFFRRGRTNPPSGPSDTLMYIVEWRDQGVTNSISELKSR